MASTLSPCLNRIPHILWVCHKILAAAHVERGPYYSVAPVFSWLYQMIWGLFPKAPWRLPSHDMRAYVCTVDDSNPA